MLLLYFVRPYTPAPTNITYHPTVGPANFTFLTVKDSGHMVPQYQPTRALAFFSRWLKGGPY
jgi:carboxypeptidase C (cathepsin A)